MAAKFKRIVVIAPTRSTCVNIHAMLTGEEIPLTLLMREKGQDLENSINNLNAAGKGGFGVVAGTGTGKTAALRSICRKVLGRELLIDIVTREHEATPYTWTCNVLVVTPGVALNWLKDGKITSADLIGIDEIHQTSEHLELAMALAKRAGCTFLWMSATIDPKIYRDYLGSERLIECTAFDPSRKATVECHTKDIDLAAFIRGRIDEIVREKRGIAIFVPTRSDAESFARELSDNRAGLHVDFYHGGENAEKLRAFLTGDVPRPFAIFMTIAGASSLNIQGLDTVIIVDEWFTEVIRSGGVKSLEKQSLGANELLQMGGRVNGRAVNGKIYILTNRRIDFHSLKPEAPKFVLGGDLERVALTCAKIEVDARDLELIDAIDHNAYARVVRRFQQRGLLTEENPPRLTKLGEKVEHLPVPPSWGEILVEAMDPKNGNRGLVILTTVCASVDQFFKLTRREWDKDCDFVVQGSDHLTAYNIVATVLGKFGYLYDGPDGTEYKFRGDWVRGYGEERVVGEFIEWCDRYGFVAREIKNIVLAMKSVYRQLGFTMFNPAADFPVVDKDSPLYNRFLELLAKVQSLDFVRHGYNFFAGTVWANNGGVSSAFQTLGSIRFFTDQKGRRRASMEGTEIPDELVQKYASKQIEALTGISGDGERVRARVSATFAGEPIESSFEMEFTPDEVPETHQDSLRHIFAEWVSLGFGRDTTGLSEVLKANSALNRKAKDLNARAGEKIFKLPNLSEFYLQNLGGARCVSEITDFNALRLPELDDDEVSRIKRENPDRIEVNGMTLSVEYIKDFYPLAKLFAKDTAADKWRDLPNEGVFLPSNRQVEVSLDFGGGETFGGMDIPDLKEGVGNYLNRRKWETWTRPECPLNFLERLERGEDIFPNIQTAVYGHCVTTGEPLYAYGTVSLKHRFRSKDSVFTFEWYVEKEVAEYAHEKARREALRIEAEAGDMRELEDAKVNAEKAQEDIRFIHDLYEEYLDKLDTDLRVRLNQLYNDTLLYKSADGFYRFMEDCAETGNKVEDAVEAIEKGEKEESKEPKKGNGFSDPGALMVDMSRRLNRWAEKE